MKKNVKRILAWTLMALMLCASCALADGSGEWYQSRTHGYVQLNSYAGWYNGYVSVDGRGGATQYDQTSVTVISKNASVWREPKTNSKRLASISHGQSLRCVTYDGYTAEQSNGFYAVEYNGQIGWINKDYVVLSTLEIVLQESNVPAYIAPDTSSKKVGSLSRGTRYRVIGFYDNYYIVNLRGAAAAFIPMSVRHYDTTFEAMYIYNGSYTYYGQTNGKTDMRTGPGREFPVLKTLSAGYQFECVDKIGGWYVVRYSDSSTDGTVYGFIGQDAAYVNGL